MEFSFTRSDLPSQSCRTWNPSARVSRSSDRITRSSETRRPPTSKAFDVRWSRSRPSDAARVGASPRALAIARRDSPARMVSKSPQAVSNDTSGLPGILQFEQLEVNAALREQRLVGPLLAEC